MKRLLVIYYSQSGDVRQMAECFVEPLEHAGVETVWECVRPVVDYPFPWRNLYRFFNVMPECVLGDPPEIGPAEFSPDERFDLVVLAYQAWFLSPSLPIQGFLKSSQADVVRDRDVITICVSRNMWQRASEQTKKLLREAGARHVDNVVVTHQGPPWATFLTTTRMLFWGKRDRLWNLLPPAGISDEGQQRVRSLGAALAQQADAIGKGHSLLRGLGAVEVYRRYVVAELVGGQVFRGWAHVIRLLGRLAGPLRFVGVILFVLCLVLLIVVGIPLSILALPLIYLIFRRSLGDYVARLEEPSGRATSEATSQRPAT